jgi:PKHD-type hydroxylase
LGHAIFAGPEESEEGELCIEDTYRLQKAKLPAGHVVLYPATSLRDDGWRSISFDLDLGIQRLNRELPNHPAAVQFTGVYHNLLRQWAEV